jgi:hypothetical protein
MIDLSWFVKARCRRTRRIERVSGGCNAGLRVHSTSIRQSADPAHGAALATAGAAPGR